MSGEGKVVCVTGASGYIASWLVNLLLRRGYTVRATVRNPHDPEKTQHLRSLDGAKEKLHLLKADLSEEGSFDSAVDGCEGVFHTASPVSFAVNDPQAELIDPALKGTINVLRSCAKVPSIKRLWYMLSKTLAEQAAWKFAKENGIDMVSINPGWVFGPLLQPTVNSSVEPILKLKNGAQTFPNRTFRYVDVRDVANAHIQVYEIPSASGRYCLVDNIMHCSEVVKILRKLYPTLTLPERCEDDKPFEPTYKVSKERAKSLGINFTPIEMSLKDTVESFKEKNLLGLANENEFPFGVQNPTTHVRQVSQIKPPRMHPGTSLRLACSFPSIQMPFPLC
ncbi:phenylacetaldehyde reductase-like isoform X2 [Malania oleifera]|uniref:phenylacetaldehyde reductase-like isoform X2 n=1 Tax=Malania oleifera TaxID=397392 RepID=UPI0025ADDDFC|nr:phenylacetaldehyde reductase-like isoform X2 [Malania oleifera]